MKQKGGRRADRDRGREGRRDVTQQKGDREQVTRQT